MCVNLEGAILRQKNEPTRCCCSHSNRNLELGVRPVWEVWELGSLIPMPCPAFCHLQYRKTDYCLTT